MKSSVKKLCMLFVFVLLLLCLSACAGAQDWEFTDLPGKYEVWRINSQTISLVSRNSEYTADTVVGSYVTEIAWDADFILVKQKPTKDAPDSETRFYMVEVSKNAVTGPMEEAEWKALLEERNIPQGEWIGVLDLKHSHS